MGAPLTELDEYASALNFFGAELRHRRLAAGLSQQQLAQKLITAASMVNKVELAHRVASADLAKRCDEVLGADGVLIRLHKLMLAERARDAEPAELPVVLSGPEARALRRLLSVDLTDMPTEVSALMPDVLDRIDFVLATSRTAVRPAGSLRRRR